MPELPEVEVVRRGLASVLTGRIIDRVDVLHPRPVRRHLAGAADFAATLTGRRFAEPRRRGKYLWLPLTDGDAILAHLGMSGQFLVADDTAPAVVAHARVVFTLAGDAPPVIFADQRMFGGLSISPGGAQLPAEISHIGLDPFDDAFIPGVAADRIRGRRTGIKRALLDQRLVSGIGNIYADEALWRARMHYARATDTLTRKAVRDVLEAATAVMAGALAEGGTSFDATYVNVNGESGYFDRSLAVYGRAGAPCRRCGHNIARESFMNRSAYRCPHCQRVPQHVRW
jgi:formamidopyrimidine-DNA glycosylase